jgi:hypothetical protein
MKFRLTMSCAAAILLLFASRATLASDGQPATTLRNLRISDAEIASAISACYDRSQTCHQLIDEIESSPTVVFLTPGQCLPPRGGSCLRFVTASSHARYLQIVVDRDLNGRPLLKALAHELQHVVEVVRAPQVVDRSSFRMLYERIGFLVSGSLMREDWETQEAQRIASIVSKEITRAQRTSPLTFK